jgi:hypothetical protein
VKFDDHDAELAEQARLRGEKRLLLGAFEVNLQQQIGAVGAEYRRVPND